MMACPVALSFAAAGTVDVRAEIYIFSSQEAEVGLRRLHIARSARLTIPAAPHARVSGGGYVVHVAASTASISAASTNTFALFSIASESCHTIAECCIMRLAAAAHS